MLKRLLPILGMLIISVASRAQSVSWNDRILLPLGVVEEKLDNGLTYILVENDSPDRMVEMRLIFRAGSVLETEENRGAAHFLEHMAFGGTKHFPGKKLVDYVESLGVQYGIGINAYTGYDRTVYQIAIPSDNPKDIDNGLLILKDWLVDIPLDKEKVDGEKGIIIEELRGYDVGDEFYNLKIGSGLYSKGIPLGTEEDIKKITPEILKEFHDKWYTLSQATVVLVGDIDKDDARQRIQKTFGSLKPTSSPDYREYPHTYDAGTNYAESQDTLLRRSTLEIMIPHECTSRRTVGDAVDSERKDMLIAALSNRFYDTGNDASLSNTWYLADKDHFTISVDGRTKEEIQETLLNAVAELYRVAKEGFTPEEMVIVRKKCLERFHIPVYRFNSSYICESIASDVMFGDRNITDPKQFEWAKEELASTLSEDLQKILVRWLFTSENSRLAALCYNPDVTQGFTPCELDLIWKKGKSTNLGKYVYEPQPEEEEEPLFEVPSWLTETAPYDASLVESRTDYEHTGVTEVILKNGFRLVLRPTNDEDRKIQLHLFSPGGLSKAPEQDYPLYENTAGYMELGGIEKLSDDDYYSLISQNEIGLIVAMEQWWHGMIASAPHDKSKLLLNLVAEKMLRPRLDYEEFEELKQSELEDFGEESYLSRLMKTDYQRQLAFRLDSLMGNLVYGRRQETTKEDIQNLSLEGMADFYKSLYGNPDGMTCVICGYFDTEDILAEAVPVFGAMNSSEPNRYGVSYYTQPVGIKVETWPNSNHSQSAFDYVLYGKYEPSLRNGLILKLMQNLVRNRLISILREGCSLVYSPYISLFYNAVPDNAFYFDVNASVDVKNTQTVHQYLDDIIRDLKANKVAKKELQTLKQIFIVNKRNYLQNDATAGWKSYLVGQLKNNESLADLENYEKVLADITPEDIRQAFCDLINLDNQIILSIGEFTPCEN
jgi:zinc protease